MKELELKKQQYQTTTHNVQKANYPPTLHFPQNMRSASASTDYGQELAGAKKH